MGNWVVTQSEEHRLWFAKLDEDAKEDILAAVLVLEAFGPSLGRPNVDTLKGSAVTNLKELRIQSKGRPFRIIFAFDPVRQAILLIGGNKQGDNRFYDKMIPIAEKIYLRHLKEVSHAELKKEKNPKDIRRK